MQHQLDENSKLILELTERIQLLELKGGSDQRPIPYPNTPYIPYQPPYQPYRPYWGQSWEIYSDTSTNLAQPIPEAEPKDTDHPADPGWHDDPDVGPDE